MCPRRLSSLTRVWAPQSLRSSPAPAAAAGCSQGSGKVPGHTQGCERCHRGCGSLEELSCLRSVVRPWLRALPCARLPHPEGILLLRITGVQGVLTAGSSCAAATAVPWVAGTGLALRLEAAWCSSFEIKHTPMQGLP